MVSLCILPRLVGGRQLDVTQQMFFANLALFKDKTITTIREKLVKIIYVDMHVKFDLIHFYRKQSRIL